VSVLARTLGEALHAALREDEAYRVLDSDPRLDGCTWGEGGCAVLAAALLRLLPGSDLVAVVHEGQVQHYLVRAEGMLFDERGASTDRAFWRDHDALYPRVSSANGARLVVLRRTTPLDGDEILCPANVVDALEAFLSRRLGLVQRTPWTSQPLPLREARKLARWWQGWMGWSAEIQKAHSQLYVVRVW